MEDNLSLSESIKARYRSMYTGIFYRRYILGEWCLAEGLIYEFDAEKHVTDDLPESGEWYISCDYGTLNPFSAGLWCVNHGRAVRVAEFYHSGREKSHQLTDEEYVNGSKITGSISSKAAATYTPGTSDQTIASGQYLSGAQTVKGDSNLVAENIKSGVSIFGVAGTYTGSGGSSGGIQAQRITSASETITISGSETVKVWGYGYKSSQYGGTTYAFVGDGYYSGSYGTPSKTNATFSISNGTLRGLPAGLTALDVLVTIGVA